LLFDGDHDEAICPWFDIENARVGRTLVPTPSKTYGMDNQEQLRQAFRSANAIVALEGWKPKPADLALQERVILGELTFDEAVQICIAEARTT
jgi:hypothetical protein